MRGAIGAALIMLTNGARPLRRRATIIRTKVGGPTPSSSACSLSQARSSSVKRTAMCLVRWSSDMVEPGWAPLRDRRAATFTIALGPDGSRFGCSNGAQTKKGLGELALARGQSKGRNAQQGQRANMRCRKDYRSRRRSAAVAAIKRFSKSNAQVVNLPRCHCETFRFSIGAAIVRLDEQNSGKRDAFLPAWTRAQHACEDIT